MVSSFSTHLKNHSQQLPDRRRACPSCHHKTDWIFLGEQEWPEDIAEKMGVPPVVETWKCGYCGTTITNPDNRR